MPKFYVYLGRLVREHVTVVVEAPDRESIDTDEVWDLYDDADWVLDELWGTEKSECNRVVGPAPDSEPVDVTLTDEEEDDSDDAADEDVLPGDGGAGEAR